MQENNIIANEEVIEEVVETAEKASNSLGKELKIAAGVGLTVLAGVAAYLYVVRPIAAKVKAKITQRKMQKAAGDFTATTGEDEVEQIPE